MNTLFLSDLHINHKNICNFRPQFTTVLEHNEVIFENYCKVVRPKDHVYFLGDVSFDLEAVSLIKKLPGIKHLILGNHCLEKNRGVSLTDLQEVYSEIYGFKRFKEFWLSHAPIHPEELRGKINIHGHVHSNSLDDPRYLNTSMEAIDYTPISLEALRAEIKNRGL